MPQVSIRAIPPIGADRTENIKAGEIFRGGDGFVRNVRGNFDQFPGAQNHFFAADLEMQRTADAVAELFAVVMMQRNLATFSQSQKRQGDVFAGEETAWKTGW